MQPLATIVELVQKAFVAMTPWLGGAAIVFVVVSLALHFHFGKYLVGGIKWFRDLTPGKRSVTVLMVCLCVWFGGSKERGPQGGYSNPPQGQGTVQQRTIPGEIVNNPDALKITAFKVDVEAQELGFEVAWTNTLFDYTDSRNLYLFTSTNLLERQWAPVGAYYMPWGTTSSVFTVTTNNVDVSMRQRFLDTFMGLGFYRFGVDVDSDGDGLADPMEMLWTLTDPAAADTDGDGLLDGEELAVGMDTDPLLYDTDGDGVGDGYEVAAGSDPLTCDTDGDGLTDLDEMGTVCMLPDFQWFDTTDGTNLLAGETGDVSLKVYSTDLVYSVAVGTQMYTRVSVDRNGILYLIPTNGTDVGTWESASGRDLRYWRPRGMTNIAVAACWDRFYALQSLGSSVRILAVPSNQCTVVEYCRMARDDCGEGTNNWVTFQVVLPSQTNDIVRVNYLEATPGSLSEVRPTIGFLDTTRAWCSDTNYLYHVQFAYNVTNPVPPQRSLEFRLGTGTNPCKVDSDEDGIDDPDELFIHHTDPLNADTDHDGRSDGDEVLGVPQTDPLDADMDNDGLPDGWEVRWGLNPFDAADGVLVDSDLDGFLNGEEMRYGTDPLHGDTDEDGLDDRAEVGWVQFGTILPQFDLSEGTNVLDAATATEDYDTDQFTVALPFVAKLGGVRSTNVTICTDGVVGFLAEKKASSDFYVSYRNKDLSDAHTTVSYNHSAVAAYWDDLYARQGTSARIRVATSMVGTNRWFVIEYAGITTYNDAWFPEPPCATFQLAMCEADPYTVHVRYVSFDNSFDDSSATIGAQGPNRKQNFPVAYNTSGSVTNGMVVSYHFGPGSDPAVADTDGDGLLDSLEAIHGSDPRRIDTDSDGIPDKWEIDHGLNPSDAADATQDPDGDELNNLNEYLNDCNPNLPDTDGDGVDDGTEVRNGSNPNDDSDGGQMPPPEFFRALTFNIYGDYAAWEMTVEGLGPDDTRIRRMSMGAPAASESEPMRMRKGNAYRISMRWLNSDGHNNPDWYCWQAQIDGKPTIHTYDWDSSIRNPGAEIIAGDGWIADNSSGLLTAHVHQQQGSGSNVAGGLIATLYVLDDPQLVPDLDRDGEIGASDVNLLANGRIFRFWTNDDHDAASTDGDVANDSGDDFPVNGRDWNTGRVNGRRDLIDFTSVWLDMSSTVTNLPPSIRNALTVRLRHPDGAMNAVWSSLDRHHANAFQTSVVGGFGPSLNGEARSAETVCIGASGVDLPPSFLQLARAGGDQGVFLVEGRSATTAPLWVEVRCDNKVVCTNRLDTSISSVEDMYRWVNSRGLSGEGVVKQTNIGEPTNLPDNLTTNRHLVFVHGANVTQSEARGWASEVFKRMWQSGMTAKFTAVTWRSDIGSDANYQENVSNAFFTASVIASEISSLPGAKVLMAHSLGNMVCSSMIQDYELVPACYLMCNSAVPAEAYDTDVSLRVPQLVHPDWEEYPTNSWASSWHWLFRNEPNDDRKFLGWPGRFSAVAQYAFNFYSTGDEVLELANNNNIHSWTGISDSLGHYSWHKQELFKGRGGLGGTDWSGWNIEENIFGVNKISVAEAQAMTEADFKTNTVFYCYPSSMNQPTIPLLVRGAHLAQGIPALTPAAGRVAFGGEPMEQKSFDCHVQIDRPNSWPERSDYQGQWCHSDLKDVAYFYVFKFYDKAIEKGSLK